MVDEEDQEKKPTPPPEPKHFNVFLNDMNSWFSKFVIENMRSDLLFNQDVLERWIDVIKTDALMLKVLAVIQLKNPVFFKKIVEKLKEM